MATLYGVNRTKALALSGDKIEMGDQGGKEKVVYESYTLASAVLGVGDVIQIYKLPAGARVTEVVMSYESLGSTGKATVGWAAGSGPGADEAADADGFIPEETMSSATGIAKMTDAYNSAGAFKKFTSDVIIQLACTEISTEDAATIKFLIKYILD